MHQVRIGFARPPAGLLRHVLRVVLTGIAFVTFFSGASLLGWVVLRLVHLGPGSLTQRQRRCQRLVRAPAAGQATAPARRRSPCPRRILLRAP